jgi:hypothetical protein
MSDFSTTLGKQAGCDELNSRFQWFYGSTEPLNPYPFMNWGDTGNDLWKQRNQANNAWIVRGILSTDYFGLTTNTNFNINIKGKKVGLEIYYAGSDDIRIRKGIICVNDGTSHLIEFTSETSLTGESGFAAEWKFITIDDIGAIQLRSATGANTGRPTNSYYQLSGYDYDKKGYYYDADERIIGALWRVNATTYYIINNFEGIMESGVNVEGYWSIGINGELSCWGNDTSSITNNSNGSVSISFPVSFKDTGYKTNAISTSTVGGSAWFPYSQSSKTISSISISFNDYVGVARTGTLSADWVAKGFVI